MLCPILCNCSFTAFTSSKSRMSCSVKIVRSENGIQRISRGKRYLCNQGSVGECEKLCVLKKQKIKEQLEAMNHSAVNKFRLPRGESWPKCCRPSVGCSSELLFEPWFNSQYDRTKTNRLLEARLVGICFSCHPSDSRTCDSAIHYLSFSLLALSKRFNFGSVTRCHHHRVVARL